jgi:farnesyl-diphosphate farnesyltransferase
VAGIHPGELDDPAHAAQAQQVMHLLIAKARGHLDDALRYCVLLPRRAWRIRIFCLTSLYFAVATLARAERDPRLLDPAHKVKITRQQVYRTVMVTHAIAPSNALVRGYFRHLATA